LSLWIFRALALVAGICLAVQPTLNARLRATVGYPLVAAAISFIIGALTLIATVAITRTPAPSIASITRVPWYAWAGGFVGAVYVASALVAVTRLGAASMVPILVVGMISGAVLIDQFGLIGALERPLTLARLCGVVLLIAGVALINRA
jgi:transporter family-2 protein